MTEVISIKKISEPQVYIILLRASNPQGNVLHHQGNVCQKKFKNHRNPVATRVISSSMSAITTAKIEFLAGKNLARKT